MADRKSFRTSAALLVGGELVFIGAGLFHPAHEAANDHPAAFTEYAHSDAWEAIHTGQFVGIALIMAGLVALYSALDASFRRATLSRLAAVGAVVTVALYGVLQAVDGVALKQAVDAWQHAGGSVDSATFSSAETVRWLEWAVRSYEQLVQGTTLILFAVVIIKMVPVSRVIAYLAAVAGTAYIVQGAVIGADGFSTLSGHVGPIALVFDFAWIVSFAVSTRRDGPTSRASITSPDARSFATS